MSLVLVADDEPAVLEVLTEVVEDLGHQVVRAHDGREALNLAKQQHPQLVVTDHMMPRLSGVELCRALKSDDDLRAVPVILLSAALPPEANEASAFLAKPFELDEFESLVKRTLLTGEAPPTERAAPAPSEAPNDLAHWVAFELRTPLAAARAHLQMLNRKVSSSTTAAEGHHLEMVARQLEEVEQVIEKMTDASRATQGQLKLELERLNLQDVVRAAVSAWREREPACELELNGEGELLVRGDRRRLTQVIGILISNAVRSGAETRRIRVEMGPVNGSVQVRVRDVGGGASDVEEDKLDPLQPGPGLGLFIASELIRLHGGTLQAYSEPGSGPVFTVTLPRAE